MSTEIETNINELKKSFTIIVNLRNDVIATFANLQSIIIKLNEIYAEFIKNSKDHLFVFGLDSLRFQCKIIDIEYDDMKRLFMAINNRMYCEHYKLYKIIIEYVNEQTGNTKIIELIKANQSKFPLYKDLEPFKQYDFQVVHDLHEFILILLTALCDHMINKETELKIYQQKNKSGLNIDNFVNAFSYSIVMLREKINLFIEYLFFFQKLHSKYLTRFVSKVHLLMHNVNTDLHLEEANKISLDMDLDTESQTEPAANNIVLTIDVDDTAEEVSVLSTDTPKHANKKKVVMDVFTLPSQESEGEPIKPKRVYKKKISEKKDNQ